MRIFFKWVYKINLSLSLGVPVIIVLICSDCHRIVRYGNRMHVIRHFWYAATLLSLCHSIVPAMTREQYCRSICKRLLRYLQEITAVLV